MSIFTSSRFGRFTLTACALTVCIGAQAAEGNCIVAGRLNADQAWAPRMAGVELLAQDGTRISGAGKDALASVRQVRLSRQAVLSTCDGDRELTRADDTPAQAKGPVPAVRPGRELLAVESVSYPKLRLGGELVELKLTVPAQRVVVVTR